MAYKNNRSSVAMSFKDFGHRWEEEFAEEVAFFVQGICRTVSKAEQDGAGNIEEGKGR
jgi:hypothetical protein